MFVSISCLYADTDECQGSHGCDHRCVNTHGSFRCGCNHGFLLKGDKRTCSGRCDAHREGLVVSHPAPSLCELIIVQSCNNKLAETRGWTRD